MRHARTSKRVFAIWRWPRLSIAGWLSRLLTHPVKGLENYEMLFQALLNGNGAIKVYCEVADAS